MSVVIQSKIATNPISEHAMEHNVTFYNGYFLESIHHVPKCWPLKFPNL